MTTSLRGVLAALGVYRVFGTRRRPGALAPALERRRSEIAAENYAARHLLEHTLDRKAALRRLAPASPQAARRYRELLAYELEALQDLDRGMRGVMGGRELGDFQAESAEAIGRLRTEIAWCDGLLRRAPPSPADE